VTSSVWEESLQTWDDDDALRRCEVPLLYLDAGTPNADLGRAAELRPDLVIGRTIGSGHFSPRRSRSRSTRRCNGSWKSVSVEEQRHACGVGNCARITRSQRRSGTKRRWLIIRCALGVTGHRAPGPIGFQRAEDRLGHRLGTAPEHAQRSAVGAGGELGNRGVEALVSAGVVDEHADGALGLGDVRHRRYPRTSFL